MTRLSLNFEKRIYSLMKNTGKDNCKDCEYRDADYCWLFQQYLKPTTTETYKKLSYCRNFTLYMRKESDILNNNEM